MDPSVTSVAAPTRPQDTDRPLPLPASSRVRQTRKSIATHRRIIEAAIHCFLEIGYHRTTTSEIAKRARVTRGAVQYYFPTTPEVLRATAEHIQTSFLAEFDDAMKALPAGADTIDQGIDKIWEMVRTNPLWTAWRELIAAARTDDELRAVMYPASASFEERGFESAKAAYPELYARDPQRFALGRQITWQVVQGLAATPMGPGADSAKQALVDGLKAHMHDFWGVPRRVG